IEAMRMMKQEGCTDLAMTLEESLFEVSVDLLYLLCRVAAVVQYIPSLVPFDLPMVLIKPPYACSSTAAVC
nr:hypothetical protein [Tanacetum cinerariifolium]